MQKRRINLQKQRAVVQLRVAALYIRCYTGVLNQIGAPAVSQGGKSCKTGVLGRAGHRERAQSSS